MSTSLKSIGVIALFVDDLERSKAFYQDAFGLPVTYEAETSAVFKFENTLINLLDTPAAHELVTPGVFASRDAGLRTASFTDFDGHVWEIAQPLP